MVSIVWSYPGFHALPRGVKQLLLISENLFFEQAKPRERPAKRTNQTLAWVSITPAGLKQPRVPAEAGFKFVGMTN